MGRHDTETETKCPHKKDQERYAPLHRLGTFLKMEVGRIKLSDPDLRLRGAGRPAVEQHRGETGVPVRHFAKTVR